MTQLEIIPTRIIEYKPKPFQDTAHQTGVALCEDGLRYFVKGMNGEVAVCATEWICTSIARSLNLPVPPVKILQGKDGSLVFGSQALPHCLPDIEASMMLIDGAGNTNVPELRNVLSASYALDQLISNPDRHDRNFLIQKIGILDGQESANIHLIDFGHAELLNGGSQWTPLSERSHTVSYGRRFRKAHGFSLESAMSVFNRFRKGRGLIFDNAMIGLPPAWLSKNSRESLIRRVMSNEFDARIWELSQGFQNGAYL